MNTQMMLWIASTGAVACMASVIIALLAGMRYSAHLRRMPAATALENVVERLMVGRDELKRVEADSQRQREEHNALRADLDGMIVRRKEEETRLHDLQQDVANLDHYRAEIVKVRDELTEDRTQLAEVLRDLAERRAEYNEMILAAERAKAQIALLDERKAEIEALVTAEHEMRTRLTEARGEFDYINRQLAVARVENDRLAVEREKLITETQNLEDKRIESKNELAKLVKERDPLAEELEKSRQELNVVSQEIKTTRKQLQDFEEELANLHAARGATEVVLETARAELVKTQNDLEPARQEYLLAVTQLRSISNQLNDTKDQLQEKSNTLIQMQEATETANATLQAVQLDLEKVRQEYDPLVSEADNLRREIAGSQEKRQELEEILAGLYAARAINEAATATTREELEDLKAELAQHQTLKAELEFLRLKITEARDRRQDLDDEYAQKSARLREIEEKLQKHQPIEGPTGGEPETDDTLADLVRPPACLEQKKVQRPVSEKDALQQVRRHLEALKLHFPERTLYAFHTALKIAPISPLTVLAGISGTGKSLLPRRYAEAMGIDFLKIPVQPRWDSPQDMLGFYNYLEKRYKATELARALVHFDRYNWPVQAKIFKDRLLIVLLDEMNLARVEYYFSEFLSQLEGRPAPDQPDMDGIRKSEIMLDIGGASGKSCRIYPGHDMLFVGTMNEDESTQTLSDKVLDRANLLRFTRPNQLVNEALQGTGTPTDAYLPAPRWHGWRRQFRELPDHLRDKITTLVERLNNQLDELHRPFAHRVNQAMLAYIANYPGVAEPERGDGWESARMAFADQLEQRILPKLRGVDLGDARISQPLRQIGDLIKDELHDETLFAAFQRASQDDGSGRPFSWMGVRREDAS